MSQMNTMLLVSTMVGLHLTTSAQKTSNDISYPISVDQGAKVTLGHWYLNETNLRKFVMKI